MLERIAEAWHDEREKISVSSVDVVEQLRQQVEPSPDGIVHALDHGMLESGFYALRRTNDTRYGGFGGAPKFPRPAAFNFLLRYWARTGNREALDMVLGTLGTMAAGGIHDQLGGGFHRYAVDERWRVPHFEKMLYDQAQIAVSLVEAFQITGDARVRAPPRGAPSTTCCATCATPAARSTPPRTPTVPRTPRTRKPRARAPSTSGPKQRSNRPSACPLRIGCVSAMASSRTATWSPTRTASSPARTFSTRHTPWRRRQGRPEDRSKRCGKVWPAPGASCWRRAASGPGPHRDDKILTAWNGLAISAFARAGAALGEPVYTDAAVAAADFIASRMYDPDGVLLRRYREGDAAIPGFLDDYAFFAQACLDLYESAFDLRWLSLAGRLTDAMRERFEDAGEGAFFTTPGDDPSLVLRIKDDYDGAEPSGNSVAI